MKEKAILLLFWLVLSSAFNCNPPQALSEEIPALQVADTLRDEKSYQLAAEEYKEVLNSPGLSEALVREIKFKLADCEWRTKDQARYEQAQKTLLELIEFKDHDRWWGESNESLAEYYLDIDRWSHTNEVKQYLENARDFWAGSSSKEMARKRFIKISFTLGDYVTQNWGWYSNVITPIGSAREGIPPQPSPQGLHDLYKEILKLADHDQDKAKATYSLAMCYLNQYGNEKERKLAEKYFREVIEKYSTSEWADDSYYQLAQYYERNNDFVKALETYRGFLTRFSQGDSQWVNEAQNRIKDISSPGLRVGVGYNFLPDSEIQFSLGWHNIKEAQFTFYKLDLVEALQFNRSKLPTDYDYGIENYSTLMKNLVEARRYSSLPVALSFKRTLKDEGKYIWYDESKGLAEWQKTDDKSELDPQKGILPPGTYLLVVSSGETMAYEMVMVTDLGLVAKVAGRSALFFTFDSKSGKPRAGAKIKFHYRYYDDNGSWLWDEVLGVTDDNGLFKASLKTSSKNNYNNQHDVFASASDGTMQAFSQNNYYSYYGGKGDWWLYAYSDRPAYRPNEEVSFKGILRRYDNSVFNTPDGLTVKARIYDPLGNQVKEASYTLNNFGSFNDTLTLDDKAPLGEYRIQLWSENWNTTLANATLFRLEEYKLPEFQVNIKPKPKDDKKQSSSYRLGDTISVELDASYYFGGPVANAEVEYLIYQNPYYQYYFPKRAYEWYYDYLRPQNYYYGNGQLLTQGKIKTDAKGQAVFSFETPKDSPNDLRYTIEARVVDQSRREIKATSELKVMRTSYLVYLNPKQYLYRPGDKAEVEIKTLNANDEPQSVEGKITVSRNWWQDPVVEIDNARKSVPIEDKESMLRADKVIDPGHYQGTELFSKFVKTNERGGAVFEFEPDQDGYYVISFTGFDEGGQEVKSSTNVYICDKQSKEIGYRYGGLQIIAEKDTFKVGDTARVMVVSDKPDTWALFTTETEDILSEQMVHMEGPVKLIEVPIIDSYAPNVFFTAVAGSDYQLKTHETQVIVPPDDKFLNVKITSDKETYNPREQGNFEIEVTDKNGKPVIGEIGLGITDVSVYYIQSEYVPDIRQYFYGDKRNHSVATQTSFNQRPYMRLVRSEDNETLMTEDERLMRDKKGQLAGGRGDLVSVSGAVLKSGNKDFELDQVGGFQGKEKSDMVARNAAAAPAMKMLADSGMRELKSPESSAEEGIGGGNEAQLATPEIRTDFRSTVLWQPTIMTDDQGKAKITVTFPDSLTTWRTTARAITAGTSVGNITQETKTNKEIIVRLQAPRFFTERDKVTVSANVHNFTDKEQNIKVTLTAKGIKLDGQDSVWVKIPASGEKRVDWRTVAETAGVAELTVMAQTEKVSDAMQRTFPIIPHGIEKFIAQALAMKNDGGQVQTQEFSLNVPKERIPGSTSLRIMLSPSMAAAMLDALPYLADYPYGCVEQTMSRFLPAVIVGKTMRELGFSKTDAENYIEHVLEPRQDPTGHPDRKSQMNLSKLDEMTRDGLKRLYDFQHSDGGWGWWKEGDSDRFMSAYVLWGLALAQKADVDVRQDVISRAIGYLQVQLVEEENNPDMLAWMLHALAQAGSKSKYEDKQSERLWEMRDGLNPYTRALFALSEHMRGNTEHSQTLARNVVNGIKEDKDNGTAHWGEADIHYRWSEGGVEATAFSIKALANIDRQSPQLEPAVKWLALNRRGARWKNTRDTAIAILGLADYLKGTNELTPDYEYEVFLNGKSISKGTVNKENMFTFDRYVDLPNEKLQDGNNIVKVTLKGKGSLYTSGYLKYFTLEENITPAGNEVFVERKYFIEDKKETLLKGIVTEWKPLKDGDELHSGDRIRVEVTMEAKNNYEYLIVEDNKPAGAEAVEIKSGSGTADVIGVDGFETGEKTWIYQEFRDQKAAFFISKLKQGKHRIRYELRAEVPGEFHAMPNVVHAMYVPEIRANSSEMRVNIIDRESDD